MEREEIKKLLTEKGIKFAKNLGTPKLLVLLEGEEEPKEEQVKAPSELMSIITDIATNLQQLNLKVAALEDKSEKVSPTVVPSTNIPIQSAPVEGKKEQEVAHEPGFFQQVPADIRATATAILGPDFDYEVVSLTDQPAFNFTIIVPSKYSELKGKEIDRRSRVIQNNLGLNGVRDWSEKVKGNIIKFLGANLTTTTL